MYGFYERRKGQREETLCAYAFLLADYKRKMLLLDYFAVCGQLRGSGYGSHAALKEAKPDKQSKE